MFLSYRFAPVLYRYAQSTVYEYSIFLAELKGMSHSGINGFLPSKVRSQQITLFEYFKIVNCATWLHTKPSCF